MHKSLTKRECQVIVLMISSHSDKAIADALFVSHSTIKAHIRTIYNKLTVSSRAELFDWFYRKGGEQWIKATYLENKVLEGK